MNYIAHIHLAHHSGTSMLGNFLGDFVKGDVIHSLSPELENGVRLHRMIDSFTDSHPLVKAYKTNFPTQLRRFSGIALDVYFDHMLVKAWVQYSNVPMGVVLKQFYLELEEFSLLEQVYFNKVRAGLLESRWLSQYEHQITCLRALQSIELRLSRRPEIAEPLYNFMQQHFQSIDELFQCFYPDLLKFVTSEQHALVTKT